MNEIANVLEPCYEQGRDVILGAQLASTSIDGLKFSGIYNHDLFFTTWVA